jgi:hypothetical protein
MSSTSTSASIPVVMSSPTLPSQSSPAHLSQPGPARTNQPREQAPLPPLATTMLPPLRSPYHWLPPSPPRRSLPPQTSTATSIPSSSPPLVSYQGEQGLDQIHTGHRAEQGPDEIHTQDANSDWSDSDSVSERSSSSILYLNLLGGSSRRREQRDTNHGRIGLAMKRRPGTPGGITATTYRIHR